MSNRKYPRLADGYHDRSQYHPYQTTGKYSKSRPNCIAERSPNDNGSGSRGNSPYNSSRHSNSSPRSHRPKASYSRSRESGKRGSSKSPSDLHVHHLTNSHGGDRHSKPNHVNDDEVSHWSQHNSSSGKVYYYNSKTEKSQWEKPKEWVERERRERERKEKEKRELANVKEGRDTNRDNNSHSRESSYSKSNNSMSKTNSRDVREKRDCAASQHSSRTVLDEQRKEVTSGSNSNARRNQVVKTCSAYTTAVSTIVHRSTPMDATPGGDTYTSPVGSVQDVSPPSTPSSRASIMETISHSPSPKLVSLALSPHLAQLPPTPHSPQLNFSQQQPPYIARHVFPQTSVSVPPGLQVQHRFTSQQQYGFPQQGQAQLNNYGQYTQMNAHVQQQAVPSAVNSVSVTPTSQQSLQVFDTPVVSQPALHPLQQATLLQQRQLAGAQHQTIANMHQSFQSVHATTSSPQVPTPGHINDRTQSSPGSPVVFTPSLAKEQYQLTSSSVVHSIPVSSVASHSQPSSASSSPIPAQKPLAPSVNLQSLAKYVDKSLTSHVTAWQTEALERQLQKLSEESMGCTSESDRIKTGQIQFHSQLGFMELRVETGTKRLAALKELTRTLDTLLAESDAKPLNSWKS